MTGIRRIEFPVRYTRGETYLDVPCRHGHDGWRYVISGRCVQCTADQYPAKKARRKQLSILAIDLSEREIEAVLSARKMQARRVMPTRITLEDLEAAVHKLRCYALGERLRVGLAPGLYLEVTGLRAQRLGDMTEADAIAEGVEQLDGGLWRDYRSDDEDGGFTSPKASFFSLWESSNGADSWDPLAWVWVIEFRRVEGALA